MSVTPDKPAEPAASSHDAPSPSWREALEQRAAELGAWMLRHHVRRIGGFLGAGCGLGLMLVGLGPQGLAVLFVATSLLLAEYEPWLRARFGAKSPSASARK